MLPSVTERLLLSAVAATLLGTACTTTSPPDDRARPAPVRVEPSPTAARRSATQPPALKLQIIVKPPYRGLARQAVQDLKVLGFWDDFTRHLYAMKLASRPAKGVAPEKETLADAFLRAQIDKDGRGALCDIVFYADAIAPDLERWRAYYAAGSIDRAPPESLRQYWALLLGHELAHCLPGRRDEPVAEAWEARVLEAMRERGRI